MTTHEQLQERLQALSAISRQFEERQQLLMRSLPEMEPTMAGRALDQLTSERQQHQADLLALQTEIEAARNAGRP